MSFSFSVRAATKADALAAVSAELDKVVAQQPVHAMDRDQAESTAIVHIHMLGDDDTKDVSVTLSGSIGGTWGDGELVSVSNTSISVHTALLSKDQI